MGPFEWKERAVGFSSIFSSFLHHLADECISFSCFVPLVLAGCNELSVRKPSILRFSEPNQTLTKAQRQFAATLSHDCQLFSNSSWRIARRRCIVDCRIMGTGDGGSSTTICSAVLPLFCPACYHVRRLLSLNAAKFHSQPLENSRQLFSLRCRGEPWKGLRLHRKCNECRMPPQPDYVHQSCALPLAPPFAKRNRLRKKTKFAAR